MSMGAKIWRPASRNSLRESESSPPPPSPSIRSRTPSNSGRGSLENFFMLASKTWFAPEEPGKPSVFKHIKSRPSFSSSDSTFSMDSSHLDSPFNSSPSKSHRGAPSLSPTVRSMASSGNSSFRSPSIQSPRSGRVKSGREQITAAQVDELNQILGSPSRPHSSLSMRSNSISGGPRGFNGLTSPSRAPSVLSHSSSFRSPRLESQNPLPGLTPRSPRNHFVQVENDCARSPSFRSSREEPFSPPSRPATVSSMRPTDFPSHLPPRSPSHFPGVRSSSRQSNLYSHDAPLSESYSSSVSPRVLADQAIMRNSPFLNKDQVNLPFRFGGNETSTHMFPSVKSRSPSQRSSQVGSPTPRSPSLNHQQSPKSPLVRSPSGRGSFSFAPRSEVDRQQSLDSIMHDAVSPSARSHLPPQSPLFGILPEGQNQNRRQLSPTMSRAGLSNHGSPRVPLFTPISPNSLHRQSEFDHENDYPEHEHLSPGTDSRGTFSHGAFDFGGHGSGYREDGEGYFGQGEEGYDGVGYEGHDDYDGEGGYEDDEHYHGENLHFEGDEEDVFEGEYHEE